MPSLASLECGPFVNGRSHPGPSRPATIVKGGFLHENPFSCDSNFSNGAKLALIVALSHRPEVLLLDEPTSGLDPLIRRDFLSAMVGLLKDRDRIVLFSTHILSDVERVSDQVIVMHEGRIAAHDTLEALRARFRKLSLLFRTPPHEDFAIPVPDAWRRGFASGLPSWTRKRTSTSFATMPMSPTWRFIR